MELLKRFEDIKSGDTLLVEWIYGEKYKPVKDNLPETSTVIGVVVTEPQKSSAVSILLNVKYSNDATISVGKPIALSGNMFKITDARKMGFKFKRIARLKPSEVSIYMI